MIWVVRGSYCILTLMVFMLMLMPKQLKPWQKTTFALACSFFSLALTAFAPAMIFHAALLIPMMIILLIEAKQTVYILLPFGLIIFIALSSINNQIQFYDQLLATVLFMLYGIIALIWKSHLRSISETSEELNLTIQRQEKEQRELFDSREREWKEELNEIKNDNKELRKLTDNKDTTKCKNLLDFLTETEREDIRLHVEEGLTLDEIADKVHRSKAAINSRRRVADDKLKDEKSSLKKLEKLLTDCGYYRVNKKSVE